MRRKDREITDKNEIMDIIDRSKVIRIAFTGEEYPYVLPFNFGYEEKNGSLSLFFHCAREGRKLDILQNRPEVSFEMDGDHALLEGDVPCRYSYAYGCVMGRGVVEFLREDEEKMHALRRIMLHQTGRDADFTPGMVRSVCVLRLKVEAVSAKLHACPEPPPSR